MGHPVKTFDAAEGRSNVRALASHRAFRPARHDDGCRTVDASGEASEAVWRRVRVATAVTSAVLWGLVQRMGDRPGDLLVSAAVVMAAHTAIVIAVVWTGTE